MRKLKIEINEKGEVRLEDQAQWVAAASGRVLDAEVRQQSEIKDPQMIRYDGVYMIANNLGFLRSPWKNLPNSCRSEEGRWLIYKVGTIKIKKLLGVNI